MRFYVGLSTNGTLIDAPMADRIAAMGFDYVGISLTASAPRTTSSAAWQALSTRAWGDACCRARRQGGHALHHDGDERARPVPLLRLMRDEKIDKFYFSHLNYAGRGNIHRPGDAQFETTRQALDVLYGRTSEAAAWAGSEQEFVTGNNDADGAWLLQLDVRALPALAAAAARAAGGQWGGNAGVNGNIDNLGRCTRHHVVAPQPGQRARAAPSPRSGWTPRPAGMRGLKMKPRSKGAVKAQCRHFWTSAAATRARAPKQVTGDAWAATRACYPRRQRDRRAVETRREPRRHLASTRCWRWCIDPGLLRHRCRHGARPGRAGDAAAPLPRAMRRLPRRAAPRRHGPGCCLRACSVCARPATAVITGPPGHADAGLRRQLEAEQIAALSPTGSTRR